ncbi:MAG: alpha/beta hydrolase [Myxococcales bacterium]|nr:MAG: alpha/beta hydrolase [Myxococcales bacterium]
MGGDDDVSSHSEGFVGSGGEELLARTWEPEGPARAVLLLVHGLGEHTGRYEHVGDYLAARGVRVCGYDQRGHGRSGGRTGWISAFDDFLADLALFHERVRATAGGLPLVLLGHSMGGLIVTAYVLDRRPRPDYLVLSSPAIVPIVEEGGRTIDAATLSHGPAVQEAYLTDPLVLRERVTEDLLLRIFEGVVHVDGRASEIALPVLLIHGSSDALCSAEGARTYLEASSSPDLTVKIYEDGRHEMFNETCKTEVLADLGAWIEARIAPPMPD